MSDSDPDVSDPDFTPPTEDEREAFIARLWQLGPTIAGAPPHGRRVGLRFVSVDRARASLALDYNADFVGDVAAGTLHGGAVTTLLDQTAGLAAFAGFARPTSVATLNLHIDYQRAAEPGQTLIATAFAYKVTRHIAFIRVTAHHGDPDDPVATAQASFMATQGA